MENIPMEEEMAAIPLNSTYSGGHGHMMIHHQNNNHIIIPSSNPLITPPNIPIFDTKKKMAVIKYKECMKNHAASMGGNATDGCGEFMPSGDEGSLEALTCSACNCHRNFHRKETDQGDNIPHHQRLLMARTFHNKGFHHHHHMIMSYNNHMGGGGGGGGGSDQSDHHHEHDQQMMMVMKKRFRTKFSQEQKEKMFEFAEKAGWKIQKLEESVVQKFCQEVGVKRRVLKVWMHNNKYNLAKKNVNLSINHDDDDQNQVDLEHC